MQSDNNIRLMTDSKQIMAAARTINQSFTADPLIRWLRPNARPWAENDAQSMKWQYRRVKRALAEGSVIGFSACNINKSAHAEPTKAAGDDAYRKHTSSSPLDSYAAIAIFEFHQHGWKERMGRFSPSAWMWLLDRICPVADPGSDDKVLAPFLHSNMPRLCYRKEKTKNAELENQADEIAAYIEHDGIPRHSR